MRLRTSLVSALGVVTLAACAEQPVAPVATTLPASLETTLTLSEIDGSYLVRFADRAVPAGFADQVAALGGTVTFAHAGAGVGAVRGLSAAAAGELAKAAGVSAVLADDMTVLDEPVGGTTLEDVADAAVESPTNPAGAVRFARQWHLQQIGAPAAWSAGRLGSSAVRVVVIDGGIDYTHPDLAGRVDLTLSKSFLPAEDLRVQAAFPGAHPVADLYLHGTHVGATIASNALAAAGVTSRVTLVGAKVCTAPSAAFPSGTCPTSAVLNAVLYAADIGAHVANMSLGGAFLRRDASARGGDGPSFIATINQVFNYAYAQGLTVVVSAGNSNIDLDHDGNGYKAYCSTATVICVSATGPTAGATNGPWTNIDAKAPYSNYGRSSVTFAAPGGSFQPVWAACSRFSLTLPICRTGTFVLGINGTSMASPHVAGLAALLVETYGRNPAAILDAIAASADDLGKSGTDPIYGKGRINVARAVGAI